MAEVNISKDLYGSIAVSFPYDPSIITKIKTIEGRRWHPVEKKLDFSNTPSPLPLRLPARSVSAKAGEREG
jgi:hypothetical protein